MNDKDIFELFQNGFIAGNTSVSYFRLCNFVSAMRCGQYYPISDEDIHRGIEYKKAEGKVLLKMIDPIIPKKDKRLSESMVETFCDQCLQQFLHYKHTYENKNNHVIGNRKTF